MRKKADTERPGFLKGHLLPPLAIFLIPLFSFWFFGHAEKKTDERILKDLERLIQKDASLSTEKKNVQIAFFERTPVSEILDSRHPEYADLRPMFKSVSTEYTIFRACRHLALACLAAVIAAAVIVTLGVIWSLRSQAAQYRSLLLSWPFLKVIGTLEVVCQGILAVFLSYWVTALWFQVYSIKLVGLIGILAITGMGMIIKGIFLKPDTRLVIDGEELDEARAPGLWARIREQAAKLGTVPPDRVVAGIDANFFVTEHPVTLDAREKTGRTLFVSLPLLQLLSTEEADAVLGHEMAHFSGDDTFWSKKLGPLLAKIRSYLALLSAPGITRVVFLFLEGFWKLHHISLGRLSRAREFRADKIGSELSSPEALARSLVKIAAYSDYRDTVEGGILAGKQRLGDQLQLAEMLDAGFGEKLREFVAAEASVNEKTHHPFDSHPTLAARFGNLNFEPSAALRDPAILSGNDTSWRDQIEDASGIEIRLWEAREKLIREAHEEQLAWRVTAVDEESVKIITEAFPERVFPNKKGGQAVIDYQKIVLPDGVAIRWDQIAKAELKDSFARGKMLLVRWKAPGVKRATRTRIFLNHYKTKNPPDQFLEHFRNYYTRHLVAADAK